MSGKRPRAPRIAGSRLRLLAALLLVFPGAWGCATSTPPPPMAVVPATEKPFLIDPLAGYPLTTSSGLEPEVSSAWSRLMAGTEPAEIAALARSFLDRDPSFQPAVVLLAQVELLGRRDAWVIEQLIPMTAELPDYTAAQLILARALERTGALPEAYARYRRLLPLAAPAAIKSAELEPRALEIVSRRIEDALQRGRVEDAERDLALLEEWAPEAVPTLDARWRVAVARSDLETELAIVRRLAASAPERREVSERLAELEVQRGDLRAGLERFETLVEHHPGDVELVRKLEAAKFQWRLQVLPAAVRKAVERGRLDRADLAMLLYWLVPEVRYAQVSNPPIAADILDHPRREEIVRVLNLGLMTLDENLHRFGPHDPVTRLSTLRALLELMRFVAPTTACVRQQGAGALPLSPSSICELAAACGLITEPAACLPSAPVSGPEALGLFRLVLDPLGSS